ALLHFGPRAAEVPRIERDAQTGERFLWFCGRQGLREKPETWHRLARRFVLGEAQGEGLLGIAVRQNPRALLIYRNQVRRETVSAINVINQSGELIVGNCSLVFFQHVPPGMRTQNSEIVRSVAGERQDRQMNRDNRDESSRSLELKHPRLDIGSFNTMLSEGDRLLF